MQSDGLTQSGVHLGGGNTDGACVTDLGNEIEEALDVEAGPGRCESEWGPRRELEAREDAAGDPVSLFVGVLDEVPLVVNDDEALERVGDVAGDVEVLSGELLAGVEDED